MRRSLVLLSFLLMSMPGSAVGGHVMVATEVQSCLYADGKIECSEGQFTSTYHFEGDTITRTNVFSVKKNEAIADDTKYKVIADLDSDPRNNPTGPFPQVVRAIGFPGSDAVEILSIDSTNMQSVKSTSNYFVISRFKIEKQQ